MSREMKDSGVEWIGQIPKNWIIQKIKQLSNDAVKNAFIDGDWIESKFIQGEGIRYLTTGNIGDGKYRNQGNGYISLETFKELNCKYAYPNDLVFSRLNAPYGRSCILPFDFSEYVLAVDNVILRPNENVDKKFICYVTQCSGYQESVYQSSKGTTMKRISRTNLGNILIPMPQIKVQQKIVDFLDEKVGEIDRLIDNAKKSIEEYKKYKQSVITEAVTKGLDPNVEMKDSGIGWIGEIPKNSNIGKIKFFVSKVGSGKTPRGGSQTYLNEGILFLRSQNIYDEGLKLDFPMYISKEIDEEMSNTRVIYNDVLLNITGGSIGRCCIYKEQDKNANVNQHVSIIRVKEKLMLPEFMHYYWMSLLGKMVINLYQTGGNREGMSAEAIKNSPIVIFSLHEQNDIVNYLDNKCLEINSLILKKENLILELESYKKSLIYEYVTGKKEV